MANMTLDQLDLISPNRAFDSTFPLKPYTCKTISERWLMLYTARHAVMLQHVPTYVRDAPNDKLWLFRLKWERKREREGDGETERQAATRIRWHGMLCDDFFPFHPMTRNRCECIMYVSIERRRATKLSINDAFSLRYSGSAAEYHAATGSSSRF